MTTWHNCTKSDDLQGLIISHDTGENIAVTYDPKNAALVAAAPDLLAALKSLLKEYNQHVPEDCECEGVASAAREAYAAIQKAKGE